MNLFEHLQNHLTLTSFTVLCQLPTANRLLCKKSMGALYELCPLPSLRTPQFALPSIS